jgi:hypothetical protein
LHVTAKIATEIQYCQYVTELGWYWRVPETHGIDLVTTRLYTTETIASTALAPSPGEAVSLETPDPYSIGLPIAALLQADDIRDTPGWTAYRVFEKQFDATFAGTFQVPSGGLYLLINAGEGIYTPSHPYSNVADFWLPVHVTITGEMRPA